VPYCIGLFGCTIFFHIFTNGTIFGGKVTEHKLVFWFCILLLSKISVILRGNERVIYLLSGAETFVEGNRFSASQIPHILCNPKVHYRIHNRPPPTPILRQNPVHVPIPLTERSILILFSRLHPGLPNCLFPSGLTTKTVYTPVLSIRTNSYLASLILFGLITRIKTEQDTS